MRREEWRWRRTIHKAPRVFKDSDPFVKLRFIELLERSLRIESFVRGFQLLASSFQESSTAYGMNDWRKYRVESAAGLVANS